MTLVFKKNGYGPVAMGDRPDPRSVLSSNGTNGYVILYTLFDFHQMEFQK